MKHAVYVTTQEEQDYVSMKLNNKIYGNRWNYIANDNNIFDECKNVIANGYEIISFNKFKSRYELKIGDTFEHNGFVCEVKEKIDLGKWYKIKTTRKTYFTKITEKRKRCYNNVDIVEITNKEFIKQLEENAR